MKENKNDLENISNEELVNRVKKLVRLIRYTPIPLLICNLAYFILVLLSDHIDKNLMLGLSIAFLVISVITLVVQISAAVVVKRMKDKIKNIDKTPEK